MTDRESEDMEYLYCGGSFCFDCRSEDYEEKAAEDYRSSVLGDPRLLLRNGGSVLLNGAVTYIGPFYFETEDMADRDIVRTEMRQIERCTWAVFLLDDCRCPGTVAEMVRAASLRKKISIYYIRDDRETESELRSSCWYPILLCEELNGGRVETAACRDHGDAKRRILARIGEAAVSDTEDTLP